MSRNKYFTEAERYKLECLLDMGVSVAVIAENLNKCRKTIYNEIKRGTVEFIDSELRPYKKYCADVAQMKYDIAKTHKGVKTIIFENNDLCNYISDMIINQKLSPYACAELLKQTDFEHKPCEKTIYNYIHAGLIPNVSVCDLAYKKKRKNRKVKRIPLKGTYEKTLIEERPKDIENRTEYGHWEMDTVYSGRNRSKACLLVLTERMTRQEIIIKMKDRTAYSVVDALDSLEHKLGEEQFRQTFKTITCDNGVEFSAIHEIVRNNRTELFFCHAYASSERGSNENQNKLIRRFIKKGEDINNYTDMQIQAIADWINMLPRKLFGGLSSLEKLAEIGILI